MPAARARPVRSTSVTPPSVDEANYYGHYPYEIEGNYFDQGALEVKPGVYRSEPIASGSFEPNA